MLRQLIRQNANLGLRGLALLSFLPPLLTRLVLGQAFFLSGRGKLMTPDNVTAFFTELGVPFPELNAAFVSRLEYWGGLLLIVGLATRFVALLLSSTMVVALLTADRGDFVNALGQYSTLDGDLTGVVPWVYLVFLLFLVVNGAGFLSADRLASWRLQLHGEDAVPENVMA